MQPIDIFGGSDERSRRVVIRHVVWRTLRRFVRREQYHGWKERIRDWFSPTHPVRWSWKMVAVYSARYAAMTDRLPSERTVRLGKRSDARALVASSTTH